jgi:hypothetical protein
MKKNITISIVAWIVITAFSSAQAQKIATYASKWYPGVVRENEGDLMNLMQFNEKSQFLFLISNDESSLYVNLIVSDKAAVQKIMRYGLTTWINPEAKPKKKLGIEFPVSSEKQAVPAFDRGKSGDRKEARMAMLAAKNELMILTGFGGKGEIKELDPRSNESFQGRIEMMEGGNLQISLIMSLDKLNLDMSGASEKIFSLGFETGYMDVTGQGMSTGGSTQGGGMSGGGMHGGGGMQGGGPPPGGGAQGGGSQGGVSGSQDQQERPDIGKLASPSRLWIKQVILSKQP